MVGGVLWVLPIPTIYELTVFLPTSSLRFIHPNAIPESTFEQPGLFEISVLFSRLLSL